MDYFLSEADTSVQKKNFGISASTLKIAAVIFMLFGLVSAYILETHVFDVTALTADGSSEGFSLPHILDLIFFLIGGLAFPIFCFLLVEGMEHTSDIRKYILRLLLFAIITEVIYDIANGNGWLYFKDQNVMFTLLISLLVIVGIRKFSGNLLAQAVCLFAGIFACHLSNADFGTLGYGVILTTLMYTTREKKLFFNIAGPLLTILASIFNGYLLALLAFIPINLYNGKRGFKCTCLFYSVYPVSILILHLIGMIFF
ncbi:MAG: conjugal transfer protein TraX [Lachnospiraceae bacterium]|nr:conjugal transfer protein TraX [Lachnospiraceae bacterium]